MSGRMGACKFISHQFCHRQSHALATRSAVRIRRLGISRCCCQLQILHPHPLLPNPTYFAAVAFGAFLSGQRLAATDLEDIGDGDGLGTSLALGGDNGDGRPGHVCGVVPAVS